MKDLIDQTISHLQDIRVGIAKIGDLDEALDAKTTEHDDLTAALEGLKKTLSDTKAGLTVAQLKNQRDYEEKIFESRKELEGLDNRLAAGRSDAEHWEAKAAESKQRHLEIEASIESLKRKHFGG